MREGSGSQNIVARAHWTIGSIFLGIRNLIFINFVSSTIDISNKTNTGNTNCENSNSTSESISSHS